MTNNVAVTQLCYIKTASEDAIRQSRGTNRDTKFCKLLTFSHQSRRLRGRFLRGTTELIICQKQ